MKRSASTRSTVLALGLAVTACNFGSKGEQTDRPLPEPEPSSKVAARPAEASPAPQRPREPAAPAPAAPAEATATKPDATAKPDAAAKPDATTKPDAAKGEPTSTASSPAPTSAPTLALPQVDGGLSVPSAACIQKCQARLQNCMNKPLTLDGGLPSLDSMNECKKAFEDCRGDCS